MGGGSFLRATCAARSRLVAVAATVLLGAAVLTATASVAPASASPASTSTGPRARTITGPYPAMAADLLARVNALRLRLGLGPLADDPNVTALALRWTTTMATTAQLAHNPGLAAQAPPGWAKMGENVGVGETMKQLFDAFVASPAHYRNLVDPMFTRSGVAVMIDGNGEVWVTQNFELAIGDHPRLPSSGAASRSAPSAAAPTPAPAAPPQMPDRMCFALEQLSGTGLQ